MARPDAVARWTLVGVGAVFVVSGSIVTGLYLAGVVPRAYDWQGPVFLALGAAGVTASWFGLKAGRRWPAALLAALYLPWTAVGLIGDTRQGFWPLVAGEALGFAAVAWAVVTWWRHARGARGGEAA